MKTIRHLLQSCLLGVLLFVLPAMTHAQLTFTTNNGAITITGYTGNPTVLNIPSTTNDWPVTSIGQGAFFDCSTLTTVSIPNSVTNIGVQAFDTCSSLTRATIPSSVTSIGFEAFRACTSLTNVFFQGNAPSADSSVFNGDNNPTVYYLPCTTGWADFTANTGFQTVELNVSNPTLAITSPVNGQRWSNAVFTIMSKASNNVAVANVWLQLNGGSWTNATTANGWINWSATVNLIPGTNTVSAYAAAPCGHVSATNSVSFQFVVTNQLQIHAIGLGTISPNYSNAWLEIGRNYTTTATVATNGFAFSNWVASTNWIGGTTTTKTNLPFMMASNLTLQVTFADVTKPTLTITAPRRPAST
jgi:hypothetical protein